MYSGSKKAPENRGFKIEIWFYRYIPVLIDDDYFINFST
jgi:hypothetical protein